MNCPACNNEIPDNTKFCTKCGYRFEVVENSINSEDHPMGYFPGPHPSMNQNDNPAPALPPGQSRQMQPPYPAHGQHQQPPPHHERPLHTSHASQDAGEDAKMSKYILTSFSFPFRGSGPYILFFGTVMLLIVQFSFFIFKIIATIGVGGYLAIYYFNIINLSSLPESREKPPDWPDVDAGELVSGFLMMFFLSAFSFLATISYFIYSASNNQTPAPSIILLSLLWFAIYFPMGSICVAESRNIISTLPFVVLRCIVGAPIKYYVVCLVFVLIIGFSVLILMTVASQTIHSSFVISIVALVSFLRIYTLMVMGRILGLFYKDLIK